MASSDSNGMFQHQQPSRNTNNHSPNNHRHRHHDEEAGGGPGSAKFGDYEVSGDPFDIPQAKNASLETLKRWRQAALVLNSSRRFRYTSDLKREEEKEQRRRMIRSHVQAAVLFKLAGENQIVIGPSATPSTPIGDYGIGLEQLVSITRDHNISALQEYGGMTVVEAFVGKKNVNPPDECSQLHPVASSLLIDGTAQNSTGNVFVPKNGVGVEVSGSPTEKAILFGAVKLGMHFDLARSESMILQVFPLNSEKKRGGVAVKLVLSGDGDDLAKRNDIGESRRKNFTPPLARAGIKSKDDVGHEVDNFEANGNLVMGDGDAGDSEGEYYKQVEQRQTSRTSARSSSPEPVDGNHRIIYQMENSGSVQGRDGWAAPDIDWDFGPTPLIGRTGGTTADGLPFSQASNSVDGQEASSSGRNGGSGARSESDESDQSTGSGGTDTDEGVSRRVDGDEHDEDDRDEGNDENRRSVGELESGTRRRVRNSSKTRLAGIFTAIAVQSTSAIVALSLDGLSPLGRRLFTAVLVTNLVGFLCLYVVLFPSRYISPRAAEILGSVGAAAAAFGFLLMMGIKLSLGIIILACLVVLAASVLSFMPLTELW